MAMTTTVIMVVVGVDIDDAGTDDTPASLIRNKHTSVAQSAVEKQLERWAVEKQLERYQLHTRPISRPWTNNSICALPPENFAHPVIILYAYSKILAQAQKHLVTDSHKSAPLPGMSCHTMSANGPQTQYCLDRL